MSGTMSGGGRQVARGRMGQKVARSEPTVQDIEKLQRDLDQVFEEYNQLKLKRSPLENQIQTLSSALKNMVVDRDKCKIEVNQLSVEEPNLRKQLKEQEKKASSSICDPIKVQQLTKVVEKADNQLKSVTENSKKTENEVARINKEIEEISGGRVKEQQKKISNLTKSIDKTKGEICRLKVSIKTAERNAKKIKERIETLENEIKNCEQRIFDIQKEKTDFEQVGKNLVNEIKQLNEELAERDELAEALKAELEKLQSRESKMKAIKIDLDQKLNDKNKIVKELQQRIPDLIKSIKSLKLQEIPNEEHEVLQELTPEELNEMDSKTFASSVQKAKEKLPKEIPNMQIIDQFKEQNDLFIKRSEKLQKITESRNNLRDTYNLAVRKRMQEFNNGFNLITGKLKEMYRMITLGGDAELELVDSLDPFSEGIVFSVRPPKKSWKYIQNLSGGEKTLSSLALVFALHHYKPTPIYFMDEIDAALDFKNVSIVASYIKERTKNAQFIVISHRSDMFELADYLVGVYKIFNCSKCAVVDVRKFNSKVGISEQNNNYNSSTKTQFVSQTITNTFNTNIESKTDKVESQSTNSQVTCPDNVNKENEITNNEVDSRTSEVNAHSNSENNESEVNTNSNTENNESEDNTNSNTENNESEVNFSLSLGDISIPLTPIKSPISSIKKQKTERNSIPRRSKSLRISAANELHQTSQTNENKKTPENSPKMAEKPERVLRRTPRNIRKEKFTEHSESPETSVRKRRKH